MGAKKPAAKKPELRHKRNLKIGSVTVLPGQTRDVAFQVSETYTGVPVSIFVRVIRSKVPGPTMFLTGAIHGDELNGVGVIHEIMFSGLKLLKGTLICLPVVNIFGFENHMRYMPDRRDLNRSFPGNAHGSMAYRLAHIVHKDIAGQCDYGIDLHTAAVRRTNFPHVRADLTYPEVKRITRAFGCEIIFDSEGPENCLRRRATKDGCATIVYEVGEALKFEPASIDIGVRGVKNVLKELGMLSGKASKPTYQTVIRKTKWIRSKVGGMIHFYVKPGDMVRKGDKVAVCQKLFKQERDIVTAPRDGIIIGMATLPAVNPGQPICHLATPEESLDKIQQLPRQPGSLHKMVAEELGRSFKVQK